MAKLTRKDVGWYIVTRTLAWNFLHNGAAALGWGVASYREPTRVEALRTVRNLKRRRDMNITPLEAIQLLSLVRATAKLGGSMAEVGVYRGGTARLIRDADLSRPLHLFDTFEGMPEPAPTDTKLLWGQFRKGQFSHALEDVRKYLEDCDKVYFHKGLFPATGEAVKNERFSFVHGDVPLYAATRGIFEFFYPRLLPGGIIISHDFATCRGPHQAIEEFFKDLPEPVIELPGDQAMVVKL
jgi:hypothetical protein